ncbi:hypothetical protein WN55_09034 [Dufourea novaeangliae]|uniref:Uncharacterized protein n=1 Tax=Dufourea novaeangliae TaxID=178035 RepID=A0A154P801_DUFNO|nr:hypothetical protein WN55_09034 [Dufourea novaeangliae]
MFDGLSLFASLASFIRACRASFRKILHVGSVVELKSILHSSLLLCDIQLVST